MFKKLLLTSALLATFASTSAFAQTAPFGVTGTVSPASCTVSLTGGTVNLGTVMQTAVRGYNMFNGTTNVYGMVAQSVPISVTCTTAAKIALSFVDNKAGKALALDLNDVVRFGLTDGAGTAAIGSYQISFIMSSTTVDSAAPAVYLSAPSGTSGTGTWSTRAAGTGLGSNFIVPSYPLSFAKTATATAPDAFTTLSGNLNFQTFVSKPYIDGATAAVTPTGSGTLTLVYL